ncbi:MAG: polysaccharide deacetylase family protein [Ferruginibacter sp.]
MFYLVKIPAIIRSLYKGCIWSFKTNEKVLYLTFDDGPHPSITPYVLDELKRYNAKATFFCIGKNVAAYPEIYQRIIEEGHATGNHTFDHRDGWKTKDSIYLDNIAEAKKYISSNLFRPPYGKITVFQIKQLSMPRFQMKPVMWSILSGDFNKKMKPVKCLESVLLNATAGDIVVFHDSEKAFERLKVALPGTLQYFDKQKYRFDKIIIE